MGFFLKKTNGGEFGLMGFGVNLVFDEFGACLIGIKFHDLRYKIEGSGI